MFERTLGRMGALFSVHLIAEAGGHPESIRAPPAEGDIISPFSLALARYRDLG